MCPQRIFGLAIVALVTLGGRVAAYSNQWAVHIEGGSEVAQQVARDHGFQYLDKTRARPRQEPLLCWLLTFRMGSPGVVGELNRDELKTLQLRDRDVRFQVQGSCQLQSRIGERDLCTDEGGLACFAASVPDLSVCRSRGVVRYPGFFADLWRVLKTPINRGICDTGDRGQRHLLFSRRGIQHPCHLTTRARPRQEPLLCWLLTFRMGSPGVVGELNRDELKTLQLRDRDVRFQVQGSCQLQSRIGERDLCTDEGGLACFAASVPDLSVCRSRGVVRYPGFFADLWRVLKTPINRGICDTGDRGQRHLLFSRRGIQHPCHLTVQSLGGTRFLVILRD
ncbi:hypothetical protein WN48_07638 [Eufriesea mexicana]|uniref:Peptidase S8 pro-domain domain-containing protein n=1 Tax=Eufriesea mexicana TaxID=516756 RepID=A0A310SLK2_9HYME|nr:hypothetical protein WN48_07638 [Eufriesea mexicana]